MGLSNEQYDSIIRTYNQRETRARLLADERKQEVMRKLPEYGELDSKIGECALEATRSLLSGNNDALEEANRRIDEFSREKLKVLKEAGYPEDYLEIQYVCPDCKDTGYIGQEKCHCFKQAIISILYSQSNISELLKRDNFSNLSYDYYEGEDLKRFESAVNAAHKFVDTFDQDYENLLFCGTVGTGKSFLSGCIAGELLNSGHSVIYFSAVELFELLSDIMFGKGDRNVLQSRKEDIYNCDLLIIDDLGTELTNSAIATELFSLFNERHLRRKSVVISTNLTVDELKDRYDDRIFSRIAERYRIFRISGPDIRRIRKVRNN